MRNILFYKKRRMQAQSKQLINMTQNLIMTEYKSTQQKEADDQVVHMIHEDF